MKASIVNYSLQRLKDPTTKLDEQFIGLMLEIERQYVYMNKHEKVRIDQWSKKLCQNTLNISFKEDRNLYAMLLLDMVLNRQLTEPFNKMPADGPLPALNRNALKPRLLMLQKKLLELKTNGTVLPKSRPFTSSTTPYVERYSQKNMTDREDDEGFSRRESTKPLSKNNSKKETRTTTPVRRELTFNDDFPGQSDDVEQTQVNSTNGNLNRSIDKKSLSQQIKSKSATNLLDLDKINLMADKMLIKNSQLSDLDRSSTDIDKRQSHKVHSQEIKEILRLQAEVELLKFSEESLKKELDQKLVDQNTLSRDNEMIMNQNKKLSEQITALSEFFLATKRRVEDGCVQFKDFPTAEATVNDINKICVLLSVPPIIKAPKLTDKTYGLSKQSFDCGTHSQANPIFNSSFFENQQPKINLDTSNSRSHSRNCGELDELQDCVLQNPLHQESFSQPITGQKNRTTEPLANIQNSPTLIDTFRYELEGMRSKDSHLINEAALRRESAVFPKDEVSLKSGEKSSVAAKMDYVNYFEQMQKENELENERIRPKSSYLRIYSKDTA